MMRETIIPLLVIAAVAAGGWYYREPLKQQFDKSKSSLPFSAASSRAQPPFPEQQASSAPHKDTIYRWVDEKGVTHYDQQATAGSEAVVVDQAKIQSLDGSPYGMPNSTNGDGRAVVEARGEQPQKSMRAVDRFPQTQIVSPP